MKIAQDKCPKCNKTVYPNEALTIDSKKWHSGCVKCSYVLPETGKECGITLNLKTALVFDHVIYCKNHVPKPKATTTMDQTTEGSLAAAKLKAMSREGQTRGEAAPSTTASFERSPASSRSPAAPPASTSTYEAPTSTYEAPTYNEPEPEPEPEPENYEQPAAPSYPSYEEPQDAPDAPPEEEWQ